MAGQYVSTDSVEEAKTVQAELYSTYLKDNIISMFSCIREITEADGLVTQESFDLDSQDTLTSVAIETIKKSTELALKRAYITDDLIRQVLLEEGLIK